MLCFDTCHMHLLVRLFDNFKSSSDKSHQQGSRQTRVASPGRPSAVHPRICTVETKLKIPTDTGALLRKRSDLGTDGLWVIRCEARLWRCCSTRADVVFSRRCEQRKQLQVELQYFNCFIRRNLSGASRQWQPRWSFHNVILHPSTSTPSCDASNSCVFAGKSLHRGDVCVAMTQVRS